MSETETVKRLALASMQDEVREVDEANGWYKHGGKRL